MRQQQDEPGRFSICSRQAAVVLIGNINIDNYHMLSALAGIAGFDRSIEFTCEISASIEIMEDDFVNKAGILKMLDEFIENDFSIKLV
ncbi:hypothetical protein [Escherichia coli]|uniref:hypothetical protein n=3 Tax=Escherichia coli TaxID=562 RepID=UPI00155DB39C|nr:hypothetical protein [Escherichia coli]